MKPRKHLCSTKIAKPQLEPVCFEFAHPIAASVCIAGTFNDWHAEAKPMHLVGEGRWLKEMALPSGVYEYCLVVDGVWIPDPRATETVPNPFGGRNSLLKVSRSPIPSHLADSGPLALKN